MAGIIKATETAASGQALGQALAARTYQFHDVGESYVGQVRSQTSKIVADAKREAAQIKAKAQTEGQQAALAAVEASLRTKLDQQLGSVLSALQQAVAGIAASRQAWQQRWEEQAVKLAAAIASRIVRRELSQHPEISLEWIREALELAAGSGQIVLKINPQDQAALGDRLDRVLAEM